VSWQRGHLRLGFTPREGLVLHEVAYDDRGTLRPILHRASLAETYVPYGDPAPTHRFKNVFDQGEYGVGGLANPLTLACDCAARPAPTTRRATRGRCGAPRSAARPRARATPRPSTRAPGASRTRRRPRRSAARPATS